MTKHTLVVFDINLQSESKSESILITTYVYLINELVKYMEKIQVPHNP